LLQWTIIINQRKEFLLSESFKGPSQPDFPAKTDEGPSLSMISSSITSKGKLKDVIALASDEDQCRGPRTVGCMVVQWPVCHPGCTPSKLPGFVVQIS